MKLVVVVKLDAGVAGHHVIGLVLAAQQVTVVTLLGKRVSEIDRDAFHAAQF